MKLRAQFDQKALFKTCRQLVKQQRHEEALAELRWALERDFLDTSGIAQAGRLLRQLDIPATLNAALLGQFTTSFLETALQATAARHGYILSVESENYDNVMQSLMALPAGLDIVVLLPWQQRLLEPGPRPPEQRIDEELSFWQQAWQLLREHSSARIVQVGYDWIDAGAAGQFLAGQPQGEIRLLRDLNRALADKLPDSAYFVDLELVAGMAGRRRFYDSRNYFWTRQPFSEEGLVLLSRSVWAGIRATLTGPKKVLVLDLDNTLWGGVVGETGPRGIGLGDDPAGEAFRSFQRLVKQLGDRGCVLAVCSKNNDADAREPFTENGDMILKLDDFAAFKAGWGPKSESIRQIAEELRLGLDSFVFFDDSKAEQEEVRTALPEVAVVDVPEDPSEFRQALLDGMWFESVRLTSEDSHRAEHYQQERRRSEAKASFRSVGDYLQSLEMTAEVRALCDDDIERAVQLLGKTNQFNLTTRRHSREDVLALLARPGSVSLTARLQDKFGDYGLVSLILGSANEDDPGTLTIDSWLMSCRAIARTLEHAFFNHLVSEAKARGYKRLVGEYIPTRKNEQVRNLYPDLGFAPVTNNDEKHMFEIALGEASPAVNYVDSSVGND